MATENQRYTVSVDDELFQEIENYRFKNRFQTRSKATVDLIRYALEHLKKETTKEPQKKEPSPATPTKSRVIDLTGFFFL